MPEQDAGEVAPLATAADCVPIRASDIEREARWLREAGHTFAASLLEALWREIERRP